MNVAKAAAAVAAVVRLARISVRLRMNRENLSDKIFYDVT